MSEEGARELVVDHYRIYSLDRCLRCLNALNLGQKTLCTVTLTRARPAESPGGAEMETS